jgi:hypothetical protein
MNSEWKNGGAHEQEKEIINILVNSSLYIGMSQEERQRLLNYLVSSYFDPALGTSGLVFNKSKHNTPSS